MAGFVENINQVAQAMTPESLANINLVGQNTVNINTVAGNDANITTVANSIAHVSQVSSSIDNVTAIANDIINIDTVATVIIPNIAEILLADNNATIATAQAEIATTNAGLTHDDVVLTHADVLLTHADANTSTVQAGIATSQAKIATNQATISTTKAAEAAASAASINPNTVVATSTVASTAKTTPVNDDIFPLMDSTASYVLKKLTWSNLKATFKTYFDGIYQSALGFTPLHQGGGIGHVPGTVYIGWAGNSLKATVDVTDMGPFLFDRGSSMTSNGYQKLSSGLIIQWGCATISTTPNSVTFPIAFSNSCFSVVATNQHGSNTATYAISVSRETTTNAFTFLVGTASGNITWIAIGY